MMKDDTAQAVTWFPIINGKLRRPPDFIPVWACRLRFSYPADDTGRIICFPHNNYENDNFSLSAR
jgi:hypothetical protein